MIGLELWTNERTRLWCLFCTPTTSHHPFVHLMGGYTPPPALALMLMLRWRAGRIERWGWQVTVRDRTAQEAMQANKEEKPVGAAQQHIGNELKLKYCPLIVCSNTTQHSARKSFTPNRCQNQSSYANGSMNLQLHFWFVQPAAACATYSEGISKIHIPTRIRWFPYPPNAQIRIPAAAPTKDKRNEMKWVADKDDSGRAGFNDSLKDRTAKDCSEACVYSVVVYQCLHPKNKREPGLNYTLKRRRKASNGYSPITN